MLPGFYATAGLLSTLGNETSVASPCPADTYRSGDALYAAPADASGLNCTACPAGMSTVPGTVGASSADACLASAGYGYNASTGTAYICPQGTYNLGQNREPCASCGAGTVTTDGPGSGDVGACKVPAGHGTERAADGTLSSAPCPVGTYGRDRDTYGLVDVECTKCLEFSTTNRTGSTAPADCVTLPGYGYDDGAINLCRYGSYNPGSNQNPCSLCGEGYNTTTTAGGTSPAEGADAQTDCAVAAGWTVDGAGGIKPCVQGFYKSLLGSSACVKCPNGTTSTLTIRAVALSDCDACRPGFGNAAVEPAAPGCALCASGTWSFGYVQGGKACEPCPRPTGYNGSMVSRRGLDDPDGCYPEFMTDASRLSMTYSHIPMAEAAFDTTASNVTVSACQALCEADGGCQYYTWRDDGGGASTCKLRGGGRGAADVFAASPAALFEISEGQYVAYAADPTDYASLGADLSTFASFADAKASCDVTAACVGIKSDGAGNWKSFRGALSEFVSSKVRVRGESINPWVAEPSAA